MSDYYPTIDCQVDYYKIVDLNKASTKQNIASAKNTHHKLALNFHPDKNLDNIQESNEAMANINNIFDIIKGNYSHCSPIYQDDFLREISFRYGNFQNYFESFSNMSGELDSLSD